MYAKTVYKYVFCLCKNEALAEDIMQETFLIATENIDSFKGDSKISVWLCSIAKYLWYGTLRKDKHYKKVPIQDIENTVFDEYWLEEKLLKKEEKIELYRRIQELDEETKNIMYLRILGNLSYDEISQIVGKSVNFVRVKFFGGKEKIIKENDYE